MYAFLAWFLLASTKRGPMDAGTSFIIASIACGLASTCVVLSLWSFIRLSKLEGSFATLDDKLPPVRIRELEGAFDKMTDAFETHQQKNTAWKQSVHNSVQRMDQIMRRNEDSGKQVLDSEGNLLADVVKAPPPEGIEVAGKDAVTLSKQAALQLRYNKNRGA